MSDIVMKDMLLSLLSSLKADMFACFKKYAEDVQDLEDGVNHLEEAMGTCANSYNDMVEVHSAHT